MTKVYVSRVIPAHPGAVWAIVRDFNALPEWTGFVAESRIEQHFPAVKGGFIRNFRLKDRGGCGAPCSGGVDGFRRRKPDRAELPGRQGGMYPYLQAEGRRADPRALAGAVGP